MSAAPRRRGRGALRIAAALLGAAPVPALPAAAGDGAVAWALPSLARVGPSDPAPAGGGAPVSLAAARGETESFQIIVRAGAAPLRGVTVGVTDLRGPDGGAVPARELALAREHFVAVARTSTPGGRPGLYPDALVPFRDPATGRPPEDAAIKAQPVPVEAGRDQPFWVDVPVARDLPPGTYEGAWWARDAGGRLGGGAVELRVHRAALPRVPTLRSAINQLTGHSLAADATLVAHKVMPLWIDPAGARQLAGKGPLGVAGLGFWSGAEGGGCRMAPPPAASEVQQRATAFPAGLLLHDLVARDLAGCPALVEPARQWGRALHRAGAAALVTGAPVPELLEDPGQGRAPVDVWAVGPAEYRAAAERVRSARQAGAELWATTALADDAEAPPWLLDAAPLGYRLLPGFTSQSLGFKGLFYWAADRWGREPWREVTYRSAGGGAWPGEGVLVYPGAAAGVVGVVPSVRLKWVRDGVEDYDLVGLARAEDGLGPELAAAIGAAEVRLEATEERPARAREVVDLTGTPG